MRLLAFSGSLRRSSSNTSFLRAAARLAPTGVEVALYEGLAELPHFNPDLEGDEPASVVSLKVQILAADGLLFSTPEYAHGVPGSLKNVLDWLVSGTEFPGKPVALLNVSARGAHAQASLIETLKTMSARFIPEASATLALSGARLDEEKILGDTRSADTIRHALAAFVQAIGSG